MTTDMAMDKPGPMGWGLEDQTEEQRYTTEQKAFGEIANAEPEFVTRRAAKPVRNETLLTNVKELQKQDGIDGGFDFEYLCKGAFGGFLQWIQQYIGSCVASGGLRTSSYRATSEVFLLNDSEELMGQFIAGKDNLAPFGPFSYRAGRKFAGINGNSDGSLCAPHFRGKKEYGFLPCWASELGNFTDKFPEPRDERTYKRWGANDELLDRFKHLAVGKLLETEKLKSADDAKTAIIDHFKPAQICSVWAFRPDTQITDGNGNRVWIYTRDRSTSWPHNMSVVGFILISGKWYVKILNSWGDQAHKGKPWFLIPASLFDEWLGRAECQTDGETDMQDVGPPLELAV